MKAQGGVLSVAYRYNLDDYAKKPKPRRKQKFHGGRSEKSRRNLLRTFSKLDFRPITEHASGVILSVTLTLPGDWRTVCPDGRAWQSFTDRFFRSMDRAWGKLPRAWVLEYQTARRAPHMHIVMLHPGTVTRFEFQQLGMPARSFNFEDWLAWKWVEVVGATGHDRFRHLGAGVHIEPLPDGASPQGLAFYSASHSLWEKDQAKPPPGWPFPPVRTWGTAGLSKGGRQHKPSFH